MHIVNMQVFYAQINEGLLTLLSGVAIWLAAYVRQWLLAHAKFLGEQTDAQLAAGLNRALSNGVKIAMQKIAGSGKAVSRPASQVRHRRLCCPVC